MKIRLAPKYLLSILLCIPVLAVSSLQDAAAAGVHSRTAKQTALQQHRGKKVPRAGVTQAQVKRYYGNPTSVRKSAGPVKKQWPRITAWNYGPFTVYFERHKVIHTVRH